jgi:RNA polymerase sigma-70 factor (ECF subfamily)
MERAAVIAEEEGHAEAPDLPRRFARGEPAAFEAVVQEYAPRVARLASRLLGYQADVDDVVQDVFLLAFERAGKFRGQSSLWTWLTAITVNRCRTHWRRQRVREIGLRLLGRAGANQAPPADESSLQSERDRRIRAAIAELPARYREVIVLYYLQEMPVDEMGVVLRLSRPAIQVRLHRAREMLRGKLSKLSSED